MRTSIKEIEDGMVELVYDEAGETMVRDFFVQAGLVREELAGGLSSIPAHPGLSLHGDRLRIDDGETLISIIRREYRRGQR